MAKKKQRELLRMKIDGQVRVVDRQDYVKAKTKQLVEFGYSDLTEDTVDKQVSAVLAGEKLNVIGIS